MIFYLHIVHVIAIISSGAISKRITDITRQTPRLIPWAMDWETRSPSANQYRIWERVVFKHIQKYSNTISGIPNLTIFDKLHSYKTRGPYPRTSPYPRVAPSHIEHSSTHPFAYPLLNSPLHRRMKHLPVQIRFATSLYLRVSRNTLLENCSTTVCLICIIFTTLIKSYKLQKKPISIPPSRFLIYDFLVSVLFTSEQDVLYWHKVFKYSLSAAKL